ncbi:MAG: hypothetical protein QG566_623 [Patescibacteria group bacterium]|jgi:hypothetical protein|nr:hypothetical protein [Patescibacteria group bacterium]
MKKLNALTKNEVLEFHLPNTWYNFLSSFASEFKKGLDQFIQVQIGKHDNKLTVNVSNLFSNYGEITEKEKTNSMEGERYGYSFKIGKVNHVIKIDFEYYNTSGFSVDFINGDDYFSADTNMEKLFSNEVLELCSNWILTAELPENFEEVFKAKGKSVAS